MAKLKTKIKLYLEANSKTWDYTKVLLQNNSDGNGSFIASWDYDGLAQPTADQLASFETAGNTAETLKGVLNTRANEYKELKEQNMPLDELNEEFIRSKRQDQEKGKYDKYDL